MVCLLTKQQVAKGMVLGAIFCLMLYDFFPVVREVIRIPKPVVVLLLLTLVFLGFYIDRSQFKTTSRSSFWWEVTLISWITGFLILFTFLGGHSSVGLSISSPALWIVFVISLFELKREYQKVKAAEGTM